MEIENEAKLGYVKAHRISLETGVEREIVIEFIQTKVEDSNDATMVKCNDKKELKFLKEEIKHIFVPPWGNMYEILTKILEEEFFTIEKFVPFEYPTVDENGDFIIY